MNTENQNSELKNKDESVHSIHSISEVLFRQICHKLTNLSNLTQLFIGEISEKYWHLFSVVQFIEMISQKEMFWIAYHRQYSQHLVL